MALVVGGVQRHGPADSDGVLIAVAEREGRDGAVGDEFRADQAIGGQHFGAEMRSGKMQTVGVGSRNVPLPAEPHQRITLFQKPVVAELVAAAGEIEAVEHAFAAAVGHLQQHGAVALGRIHGFHHVEIGGALHHAIGILAGELEVADDAVGRQFRVEREMHFADDLLVGAIPHGSARGNLDGADGGAERRDREERQERHCSHP